MEIERINENTVKFFISYVDIEDRGFKREEIWYNRERSEQLFWQMMEEVNYKEDFTVEGPLWIQVQALEKGLEVVVTKAQVSKNNEQFTLPTQNNDSTDLLGNDRIEKMLNRKFGRDKNTDKTKHMIADGENLSLIVYFHQFEDVIQLSHYCENATDDIINQLFYYKENYYLYIEFPQEFFDEEEEEDIISQIYEFANDSKVTIHLLEEYGTKIFDNNTFEEVRTHFPAQI